MKRFIIKLSLIVMTHIIWFVNLSFIGAYAESTNKTILALSYFSTEPIFILTVHIALIYLLINLILKIKPVNRKETKVLLKISIMLTVLVSIRVVLLYILEIMLNGFSVFIYSTYWLDILF